jgi:hypothetical protein
LSASQIHCTLRLLPTYDHSSSHSRISAPRIMDVFHGGGEAAAPPAALTAEKRSVPTTAGSQSQNRIVWL